MKILLKLLDVTIMPMPRPGDEGTGITYQILDLEQESNTLFLVVLSAVVILLLLLSIRLVRKVSQRENIDGII